MADVNSELKKVLAPHLASLRKDLKSNWPSLDPELTLLHWLCERNNIKPPNSSLVVKEQELPPLSARGAGKSEVNQDIAYPATLRHVSGAQTERGDATLPKMPFLSISHPVVRLKPSPEDETLGLKSLRAINHCVQADAQRIGFKMDLFKYNREKVSGVIADMRQDIRGKFVAKVPLFSTEFITQEDQYWLVGKLRPCNFGAGEDIVREGDPGDTLYIIEQGLCEVFRNQDGGGTIFICSIGREDFFGELSVIHNRPRGATVRAKTDVTLLALTHNDLFSTLGSAKLHLMSMAATSRFFGNIPALRALTSKQKIHVCEMLATMTFESGSVLNWQNAIVSGQTRRMHIIQDGQCDKERKVKDRDGYRTETKRIHVGQFFGMLAMFYGCPLSHTVTACAGPVITLSISYDELLGIGGDAEGACIVRTIRDSMQKYLMREVPELQSLSDETIEWVHSQSTEVEFKRWDSIFIKDDPLDTIYILEDGSVCENLGGSTMVSDQNVRRTRKSFAQATTPGTVFGIECMEVSDFVASSTLAATSNCNMICIPGVILRSLMRKQKQNTMSAAEQAESLLQ